MVYRIYQHAPEFFTLIYISIFDIKLILLIYKYKKWGLFSPFFYLAK
jgi:hypothetical protein